MEVTMTITFHTEGPLRGLALLADRIVFEVESHQQLGDYTPHRVSVDTSAGNYRVEEACR